MSTFSDRAERLFSQIAREFGPDKCTLLKLFSDTPIVNPVPTSVTTNTRTSSSASKTFSNRDKQLANGSPRTNQTSSEDQEETDRRSLWLHHIAPPGYQPPQPTTDVGCNDGASNGTSSKSRPFFLVTNQGNSDGSRDSVNFDKHSSIVPVRLLCQPQGVDLTQNDLKRLAFFVESFVIRSLLPWAESTMRELNEQISHRNRNSRSFLSATKKFFSTSNWGVSPGSFMSSSSLLSRSQSISQPSDQPSSLANQHHPASESVLLTTVNNPAASGSNSSVASQQSTTSLTTPSSIVYTDQAPEPQMRRLADLAFLFQQYELASQTYSALKRDFQTDSAWLQLAGVEEMSAFSSFLQPNSSQRNYPHQSVENAVTLLLQTCKSPDLALRATLLNAEALRSRGQYAEAAASLLRMNSDTDKLTSALLLEQTAYCILYQYRTPSLRKFALRMSMAAERYGLAGQPHMALRCFNSILPILRNRKWSLVEDHINYNISKYAYMTNDLTASVVALGRNLTTLAARQSSNHQLLFLRDFLSVLRLQSSQRSLELPTLPLPVLSLRRVKAMRGCPVGAPSNESFESNVAQSDDSIEACPNRQVEARGIQFSDYREEEVDYKPQLTPSFGSFPYWMDASDVSDCSSFTSSSDCEDYGDYDGDIDDDPSSTPLVDLTATLSDNQLTLGLELLLTRALDRLLNGGKSNGRPTNHLEGDNTILTRTSRRSNVDKLPLIPSREHITVQLPVWNPLNIPLVLTNICLLWQFSQLPFHQPLPGPNNQQSESACANELESDDSVAESQLLPQLVLAPGQERLLDLELLVKQVGYLCITGLQLSLSPAASSSKVTEGSGNDIVTSPTTPVKTPTAPSSGQLPSSSVGARGKLVLIDDPVAGQKQELKQKHTRKLSRVVTQPITPNFDARLNWQITPSTSLLKVVFDHLLPVMLQGQVFRTTLTLTNCGTLPISTILLACQWPGFTTVGDCSSKEQGGSVYPHSTHNQQTESRTTLSPTACKLLTSPDDDTCITTILRPPNQLDPGDALTLPLWLRAPHLTYSSHRQLRRRQQRPLSPTGLQQQLGQDGLAVAPTSLRRSVNAVFAYHTESSSVLSRRLIRHRSIINLQPSLHFAAIASPSNLAEGHISDLVVALCVRNVTPSKSNTTFVIAQIACVSATWTIEPIKLSQDNYSTTNRVKPGESTMLHFRLTSTTTPHNINNGQSTDNSIEQPVTVSSLLIDGHSPVIDPTASPCIHFLAKSGSRWSPLVGGGQRKHRRRRRSNNVGTTSRLDKNLGVGLIILWKTVEQTVNTLSPSRGEPTPSSFKDCQELVGQSHIRLSRIQRPAFVPSDSQLYSRFPIAPTALNNNNQFNDMPSNRHQQHLVRCRLRLVNNDSTQNHQSSSSLPTKPQTIGPIKTNLLLELLNVSSSKVLVRIEPEGNPQSLGPSNDSTNQLAPGPKLMLTGQVKFSLELDPGQSHHLKLPCIVPAVGFYTRTNLAVLASRSGSVESPPTIFLPQPLTNCVAGQCPPFLVGLD